jgi:hypothetical protein
MQKEVCFAEHNDTWKGMCTTLRVPQALPVHVQQAHKYLMALVVSRKLIGASTVIYGDIATAHKWCTDEGISQGNIWVLETYHYVKDMAECREGMVTTKICRN